MVKEEKQIVVELLNKGINKISGHKKGRKRLSGPKS